MHSIERYGIVALLFLVVTVVAVLMWDGDKEKKKAHAPVNEPPAAVGQARLDATDSRRTEADAARRLSLVAEGQPGPLQRRPRAGRAGDAAASPAGAAANAAEAQARPAPLLAEPSGLQDDSAQAGAQPASQTPREQPAPEQVIGQHTGTAPTPPAAPALATHAYLVRAGDTLSEIAQRELGSARRWPELVAANPGLDPGKLRVGKTIQIPGAKSGPKAGVDPAASEPRTAAAPQSSPGKEASTAKASGKTWKVGQGENLWRIAERALGDGKRWREIAALNPKVNPDRLVLGQVLVLPGTAAAPAKKSGTEVAALPANAANAAATKARNEPVMVASTTGSGARRGGKVK